MKMKKIKPGKKRHNPSPWTPMIPRRHQNHRKPITTADCQCEENAQEGEQINEMSAVWKLILCDLHSSDCEWSEEKMCAFFVVVALPLICCTRVFAHFLCDDPVALHFSAFFCVRFNSIVSSLRCAMFKRARVSVFFFSQFILRVLYLPWEGSHARQCLGKSLFTVMLLIWYNFLFAQC